MRVGALVCVITVLVFLVGCGGGGGGTPEASYQGKPTGAWVEQLQDKDPATRDAALDALTAIGADDDRAVRALADLLVTTQDQQVMRKCAEALEDLGAGAKAAVPGLMAHLGDEAPRSTHISRVLESIEDESTLTALSEAIGSSDPATVRRALAPMTVLVKVMDRQEQAAPLLGKVFRSHGGNPEVQVAAAAALCDLGPRAGTELRGLLPEMAKLLDSQDPTVRAGTFDALSQFLHWSGQPAPDEEVINLVVAALAHGLDDLHLDNAHQILEAITTQQEKRKTPGAAVVPALLDLLQRNTDEVVSEAWYQNRPLKNHPEAEVIELRMKRRAVNLLALLGPEAAPARPELEKWATLEDCPEGVRITRGRCEVAEAARKALKAIPG